ncbi:hypothetical protein [Chryseobacterium caseinilyticum]|uniref:Uncharacterized protein n=1 Tax=Chryseobacterium caseinilyticum TaxID=2771428 RepID=A0ABR8ZEX7_9FLAO|nr:hypothetical protein [Chryseobacterium caseinilyticum]MBD8083856.1 hypothetical protein [Chryseobacterium caseinilyticum]
MKGICKDFKFQVWVASQKLPTFRGLFVLFFSFLFSFFSAQDSLLTKKSSETQITVIGKARIYSSDQSFNKILTSQKVNVIAVINYKSDDQAILITSAKKTKNLSQDAKLSQRKIITPIDKSVLAKLEKIEKKAAENGIAFKNHASDKFFNAGNASHINFILPDSHNHSQNSHIAQSIEITPVYILIFRTNNFYFNTRSKTFGYSKTYSLRPPPVSVV